MQYIHYIKQYIKVCKQYKCTQSNGWYTDVGRVLWWMVWTEKCTVWVSVLILCIQQPDSLRGKAILQSACAWSDAADTSAWGQQREQSMAWVAGDPLAFPHAPPGVDVLEGGKLTSYSVAGSSDIPLQSLATAAGAVSIPGGDAAGQNALLSAGVEWVEDVGTHSKFPQAPEENEALLCLQHNPPQAS